MSRRMRVLVGLGITVLVCGIFLWFFGFQTALAIQTRYMARKMPAARKVPVELPDSSVSDAPGKKLSYFGYEFETPWDDIDETKSRTIGSKVFIAFRSGKLLFVSSGPPREFVNSVLACGKVDPEIVRQLYGNEALQSDYAFHRLMLAATPDKVTPFISRKKAVSQAMLILMKGISAPRGADSGIFAVQAGEFRGFQYGRPTGSTGLSVELFADSGSLDFILVQKANGPTVISQSDINRILHTLKRPMPTRQSLRACLNNPWRYRTLSVPPIIHMSK